MPLTREKKDKLRKRYKTISAILKLLLLLFILVGLPLYIYFLIKNLLAFMISSFVTLPVEVASTAFSASKFKSQ